MEVRYVDHDGIRLLGPGEEPDPAARGFFWVDIAEWSSEAEEYLRALGCHEIELELCQARNHVPTVHGYTDHVFIATQMTVAMERLAVIAAITLLITAIASVEGMNMIVSRGENLVEFAVVLLIMGGMSFLLLRWARQQGWW